MKAKKLACALGLIILGLPMTVSARDSQGMHPISDALNGMEAKGQRDKQVRLYFGDQKHPAVLKSFGTFTANKKTNAFNKSDEEACRWAFASAVLALQARARKEGGNAVINIRSYYKKQDVSSRSEYMCGAGALMAGVTFRGTVVKLK